MRSNEKRQRIKSKSNLLHQKKSKVRFQDVFVCPDCHFLIINARESRNHTVDDDEGSFSSRSRLEFAEKTVVVVIAKRGRQAKQIRRKFELVFHFSPLPLFFLSDGLRKIHNNFLLESLN